MIRYPIREPGRTWLIEAGKAACSHHVRTSKDAQGNPDFVATAEYRRDHATVEEIIKNLERAK
jgi:hypothetical protein